MIILSPEMNFQKENEDVLVLDELFFDDVLFRLFFFDDPPFCSLASRCILDVFDFFATFIMVMGYGLLVIENRKYRMKISTNKNTIFKGKTSYYNLYYINIAMLEKKR